MNLDVNVHFFFPQLEKILMSLQQLETLVPALKTAVKDLNDLTDTLITSHNAILDQLRNLVADGLTAEAAARVQALVAEVEQTMTEVSAQRQETSAALAAAAPAPAPSPAG